MMLLYGLSTGILSCNPRPADQKGTISDSNAARFKQRSSSTVAATLERDARFAVVAAGSGMTGAELGMVAADKAFEKLVRQLGDSMAHAYGAANAELKQIAAKKNISIPAAPPDGAVLRGLRSLKGAAFDDRYLQQVKKMQETDIEQFKRYISAGKDSDLLHWAILRLPALEAHLDYVKRIDSMVMQQRRTY
ncbi:DUF4142 domain-containing protein [Niabella sp. CC-SYL272]|uniref:DUF4142 domain-containing protein n=1 Tax=Niabella agricola TaxID=2891571 RepID=UPI001F184963|nr:DUF4142 domain-containing protein [Niabella agricola]MCF3108315.1 DUF4142 domain-containing protein [Niabella agricola]